MRAVSIVGGSRIEGSFLLSPELKQEPRFIIKFSWGKYVWRSKAMLNFLKDRVTAAARIKILTSPEVSAWSRAGVWELQMAGNNLTALLSLHRLALNSVREWPGISSLSPLCWTFPFQFFFFFFFVNWWKLRIISLVSIESKLLWVSLWESLWISNPLYSSQLFRMFWGISSVVNKRGSCAGNILLKKNSLFVLTNRNPYYGRFRRSSLSKSSNVLE